MNTTPIALAIAASLAAGGDDTASTDAEIVPAGSTNKSPGRDPTRDNREDQPWIKRWAPEPNTAELGAYGGVLVPGRRLELFEADPGTADQGYERYAAAAGTIGGRVGYYPIRFFGVEAEGGAAPTRIASGDRATLWTVRGSVVGQVGLWTVTPFALVGAGALGVASPPSAAGNDVDPAVHLGGGVKVFLSRRSQIRLDVRDVIGAARGVDRGENHNLEITLGVGLTLGRKADPAKPAPAPAASPRPTDRDRDGVNDDADECPDTWGELPSGCPILDTDNDGVNDDADRCIEEPAPTPDGCPVADSDLDGIPDDADKCVDEPETANAFEDDDGCPDEVASFTGVIEGIQFDTAEATIKPGSREKLDEAASTLRKHPDLRIEIQGHTDSKGRAGYNRDLSQRRAEAVRDYLIEQGVAADQLTAQGFGPDKPRADNGTPQGRAANRRIEFKLLD